MLTAAGCDDCSIQKIFEAKGAKLAGPATVKPGVSTEFKVAGMIGPGKVCPGIVQLDYQEVNAKGVELKGPNASRGKIKDIVAPATQNAKGKCRLKGTVKIPLSISPGRTDQHQVRITARLLSPRPTKTITDLAEAVAYLVSAPARRVVTVEGTPPPPPTVPPNTPPVAAFIVSQSPAIQGKPLGLDARQSSDADGSITKYEWDLDGNGTYEKSSASPTGVQIDSAAASQTIRLRVTDSRDAQTVSAPLTVSVAPAGTAAYEGGTPTLSPELTGPNKLITVGVGTTTPAVADDAQLFCADSLSGALTSPTTGETFANRCAYPTAGFKTVTVRYSQSASSSGPQYVPTLFYRLAEIVPGARATAHTAQKAKPLSLPLSLSSGKVSKLGKVKVRGTRGTVKGLVLTGTGKGKIPKSTPKRFRSALTTLASGRFAARFTGAGRQTASQVTLTGSATMLVRSRKSRRTQMCLSVKTTRGGAATRIKVLGATGSARGFRATGTGPALALAGDTGNSTTVALTPGKGKARKLSRTCRSLARTLSR